MAHKNILLCLIAALDIFKHLSSAQKIAYLAGKNNTELLLQK